MIDPVPGGRFYTKMVFDDLGAFPQEGCILVADPGRRLAFTDCLSAGFRPKTGGFFTADITFTAKDGLRERLGRHIRAARRGGLVARLNHRGIAAENPAFRRHFQEFPESPFAPARETPGLPNCPPAALLN